MQREIEQLQSQGVADSGEGDALLTRKNDLGRLIEELVIAEE